MKSPAKSGLWRRGKKLSRVINGLNLCLKSRQISEAR
jgi:hypothetical protein